MDYRISNYVKLFDEALDILNRHQDEDGARLAIEHLQAAKVNYVQRSIDHMMNCLLLAVNDLVVHPPSEELSRDLKSLIRGFYTALSQAGARLSELSRQYEAGGGKLLSHDEILEEVDQGRGTSR